MRLTPVVLGVVSRMGLTAAFADRPARFGVIDRSVGRSPCARRSDRPKRRRAADPGPADRDLRRRRPAGLRPV